MDPNVFQPYKQHGFWEQMIMLNLSVQQSYFDDRICFCVTRERKKSRNIKVILPKKWSKDIRTLMSYSPGFFWSQEFVFIKLSPATLCVKEPKPLKTLNLRVLTMKYVMEKIGRETTKIIKDA